MFMTFQVFYLVSRWYEYDQEKRESYMAELLFNIRYHLMRWVLSMMILTVFRTRNMETFATIFALIARIILR